MRIVNVSELLEVLASNRIDTSNLERALNSDALPNASELASSILDNLNNYVHYALNDGIKKNVPNIKKFMEFIADCHKIRSERDLINIRGEYSSFCNKLPNEYREVMGNDYIGEHATTIQKYVRAYVDSLAVLKATKTKPEEQEFINEATNLLNGISNGVNGLWDVSSEHSVKVLEEAITTILKFGSDAANGFLVKTRLTGLSLVKGKIERLNSDVKTMNFQVKPTKNINTSLLVEGDLLDQEELNDFVKVGAVDVRRTEYNQFRAMVFEKTKNTQAEEEIALLKQQNDAYKAELKDLFAKLDNGLYLGTIYDFNAECEELKKLIDENEELIKTYRETARASGSGLLLEFKKLCIAVDAIANKDLGLLHEVINCIDFAKFVPIINGTSYDIDDETIKDIRFMSVIVDEIRQGSKAALSRLTEKMHKMNNRNNPVQTPVNTQDEEERRRQEEQKRKEAEEQARRLREQLFGTSGTSTPQTPQNPVEAEENPTEPIRLNAAGLLGND